MKIFIICIITLSVMCTVLIGYSVWSSYAIDELCNAISELPTPRYGEFTFSPDDMLKFEGKWKKYSFFLSLGTSNDIITNCEAAALNVKAYGVSGEASEYNASREMLMMYLRKIERSEKLSLSNIF